LKIQIKFYKIKLYYKKIYNFKTNKKDKSKNYIKPIIIKKKQCIIIILILKLKNLVINKQTITNKIL